IDLTRDSTVLLDGVAIPVEALGVPVPVDSGRHEVIVRSPGRQTETFTTKVGQAEKADLAVSPGEPETGQAHPVASPSLAPTATPPRSPEQPAPAAPPDQGSSPTPGYVIGGVGFASLGASIGTGLMALGK